MGGNYAMILLIVVQKRRRVELLLFVMKIENSTNRLRERPSVDTGGTKKAIT